MRKILSIALVALLVCLGATAAFARVGDSRIGAIKTISSGPISTAHVHVSTGPSFIYKIEFRADVATAIAQIFDSNTTGSLSTMEEHVNILSKEAAGRVLVDIGENTAGDWVKIDYQDSPIYAANGILAGTSNKDTVGGSADTSSTLSDGTLIIHYTSAE